MAEDEKILIYNAVGLNRRWWQKRWTFFYVDTPDYKADGLFEKHGVPAKIVVDYVKEGSPFVFVEFRVKYKDVEDFLDVMYELQKLMLICGHRDYEEFCREWIAKMEAEDDDR